MLQSIVLVLHLLVAVLIVVFVLLQRGKGAEAGTGFGAGASGTVFGARGTSSFFSRTTAILATLFFATSLGLAYFATQRSAPQSILEGSVLDDKGLPKEGATVQPPANEEESPEGTQVPPAIPEAPASETPGSATPPIAPPPAEPGSAPAPEPAPGDSGTND